MSHPCLIIVLRKQRGEKLASRTGTADLPLHYGNAPAWLFSRMRLLAREVMLFISSEKGPDELLERLCDPFWFQAFGCALGFDWHSSGLTTTVCGAMKEASRGIEDYLGLYIAGGKGAVSRKTPSEIEAHSERLGVDAGPLVYASRMSAKVDSGAVQDEYRIYHHTFLFTPDGKWAVVQQGMHPDNGMARRYHWLGSRVDDFVCEPHTAVCCDSKGETLNMVAAESADAREVTAGLSRERPELVVADVEKMQSLELPRRHEMLSSDVNPGRLKGILLSTYENQPAGFEQLLALRGVGPKTIRSLALLSELVYGTPASTRDPARFSFAHGGKDGIPYPVDRKTYDESIEFLNKALSAAKVGRNEKVEAFRRLNRLASQPPGS